MSAVPEPRILTVDPPEVTDGPTELAPDLVPHLDAAAPVATYRDWDPDGTRIVVYAIGDHGYPGIPAENRDAARAHCEAVHGRILEANYVPGRAFLRVARKQEKSQ